MNVDGKGACVVRSGRQTSRHGANTAVNVERMQNLFRDKSNKFDRKSVRTDIIPSCPPGLVITIDMEKRAN